jgi:hypothetical protein
VALRYADSFETYAAADLNMHWYQVTPIGDFGGTGIFSLIAAAARSGAYGLQLQQNENVGGGQVAGHLALNFAAEPTWIVGCALHLGYTPDVQGGLLQLYDGGTEQVGVYADSYGNLRLQRNGTVLVTAVNKPTWRTNAWNFLELKGTINSTTGYAEVRLNGQTILTYSGNTQASGNASANIIRWNIGFASFTHMWLDDIYVCDGAGTVNNDFLGDVRIQAIFPALAAVSQFTASGASADVLCVKEHAEDGDTTFIYTAAGGVADSFDYDQISGLAGNVPGIYLRAIARKDDAGTRIIAPIVVSSAATGVGPQGSLSNSYVSTDAIFEKDPNGNIAWTIAAVNAAQLGVTSVQ